MTLPTEITVLPSMTVAEIATLCERHDAYVRIESTAGKPYAYLQPYSDDEYIPPFLRRQENKQ